MRRLLHVLLCCFAAGSPARACDTVLVSGFDDVLRQADNTGLWNAGRRLLRPDAGYAGMPELYRALACHGDAPAFHVVSAISVRFEARARSLLAREGYPTARLQFRRWLLEWSPERFKRARIEGLLAAQPQARFVFVLDDSATSVRLGQWLRATHAPRVAAIYLRQTAARPLPEGLQPFLTAYDLAQLEAVAGRVPIDALHRIAEVLLAEPDAQRVVPEYAHCPASWSPCGASPPALAAGCERVRARVEALCRARR